MALPPRILSERPATGALVDRFARAHSYVRVSVTDRCNYRCVYCLPATGVEWMPRANLLTFEEIVRVVRCLSAMGVTGVRLTGGEPTVRRGLPDLVQQLAGIPGILDIAMTTNAHHLAKHAQALAAAGLNRVNVSLDTLDAKRFAALTRGGNVERVLAGIHAALENGLTPVKVNCVVVKGENEQDVLPLIRYFAQWPDQVQVRFIEKMPFRDEPYTTVPSATLRERVAKELTIERVRRVAGRGPSVNWRVASTGQTIGFISPMTEHFCEQCNRLRLQADGDLRTCLSRDDTPNLRDVLRAGLTDDALTTLLREMVWGKVAGHEAHTGKQTFEGVMTQIGG